MVDAIAVPPLLARLARCAGPMKHVRGFSRVVDALCPLATGARYSFDVDFFGLRYRGNLGSLIDRHVYFYGAYEADELAFVRNWWASRPGGVALDIGANVGHHTMAFSRIFRTVHAFEPNPSVFAQLQSTVNRNQIANATLHPFGLWHSDTVLQFNVPPDRNTGMGSFKEEIPGMESVEKLELPVRCGDDVLEAAGLERIDLLKIDVQGAEGEALDGLSRTLARSHPLVWVEISPTTRETVPTLASVMQKLGSYSFEPLYLTRRNSFVNCLDVQHVDEAIYARLDGNLFLRPLP